MFPTAGFFRGILCPENEPGEDNKKCRRPYCHFRHIRRVPSTDNAAEAKKAEQKPSTKTTISSSSLPSFRKHKDRTPASKPIAYIPTPLSLCKKPPPETFQDEPSQPDASEPDFVPDQPSLYTPTPLVELEARDAGELSVDEAKYDDVPEEGSSSYHLVPLDDNDFQQGGQSSSDGNSRGQAMDSEEQCDILSSSAGQAQMVQANGGHPKSSLQHSSAQDLNHGLTKSSNNQQTLSSGHEEEEAEDVIIQTHTYGGITVTTRTPKNLCMTSDDAENEDTEYDPFEADLGQVENTYRNEGHAVHERVDSVQLYDSGYSQLTSVSDDFPADARCGMFGNDEFPTGRVDTDSSDALVRQDPLYGIQAPDFKGYSQGASYSYSESGNQKTETKYDTSEPPTYSTSESAISAEQVKTKKVSSSKDSNVIGKNLDGAVLENKNKIKKTDRNSEPKKSNADISKKVVKGADKGNLDKKKVSTVKKVIKMDDETKKVVSSGSDRKPKSVGNISDKKKVVQKGKKIVTENKSIDKQKLSKEPGDETPNRTNQLKMKHEDVSIKKHEASVLCVKGTHEDTLKRKVSSEQLTDFFKKRQELKTNKNSGKVKVSPVNGDKNRSSNTSHKQTLKQSSKDIPIHEALTSKDNVGRSKVKEHMQDQKTVNKPEKHKVQESPSKDRSLFESLKKPPSKVVPSRSSVKECGIDLFAIANDSNSEDDLDDVGNTTKKSSKPKQKHHEKTNIKRTNSKSAKDSFGQVKRPASTSGHSDSKRIRTISSSLPRRDSTKLVELDLFGVDSDGDSDGGSDVIMLLDEDLPEKSQKILNKPALSSTNKSNVKAPQSSQISKKTKVHSHPTKVKSKSSLSSSAVESKHSLDSASKTFASKGLPAAEKQSNFISSKSVSPKKHSTVGKPKPLIADGQGKQRKTSIPSKGSAQELQGNSHKSFNSSRTDKRTVRDISSSDDDDNDSDTLPSGYHSVIEKDSMRDDASDSNHGNASYGEDDGFPSGSRMDSEDYMGDMKKFLEESSSDEDTFDECYRIFQEEHGEDRQTTSHRQRKPGKEMEDLEASSTGTGKQRVAHTSKSGKQRQKSAPKKPVNSIPSAAQMCHNRYLQLQQRLERAGLQEGEGAGGETSAGASVMGKRRIAHQGTNSTLNQLTHGSSPSKGTTAMTNAKMGRRVAHTPKTVTKRPVIPADFGSKVPMNIRQRYLNVFIDELLRTATTEQDAFDKALEEEKIVYQRASTKNIYLNLCVNALKKLQNSTAAILKSPTTTATMPSNRVISHEAVLGGKLATKTSYSIHRSVHAAETESFEGVFLYEKLQPFLLSEEQLRENGFPRSSDIPGQAVLYKEEQNKTVTSSDPNVQVCSRCGATFLRDPDGTYITRESCTYHWGRPWTRRIAGAIESRFSCCSGDMEAKGCCIARLHVTDNKTANLSGFMKTMSKPPSKAGHPGMYSMDCEMCYTTMGLELTRVTVINDKLEEVYDTLVKPENEVIDYNTRFSGITEEDLRDVNTRLRNVQAVLLNMFSKDTMLIGHSLESDLLALKMLHSTVIDTSVVFPHRRGPPFKRALKTLMAEFLKRLIQDDIGGHDSAEDARSCMELMIWKVKEVAKVKRKR